MSLQDYWAKLTEQRISRRRGLKLGAGLGAGALALSMIGCGGGSDNSSSTSSGGDTTGAKRSSLVTEPKDSAKDGKAGGIWKHFSRGDATHFDSLVSDTSQVVSISGYLGYAKLLRWKAGRYPQVFDGSSEGESAESWELSPDKLTLTFRLRKDMKFDRRAP